MYETVLVNADIDEGREFRKKKSRQFISGTGEGFNLVKTRGLGGCPGLRILVFETGSSRTNLYSGIGERRL